MSTGEFISLIADDLVPNFEWDFKIENFIASNGFRDGIFKFTDDRCISLTNLQNDTLLPRHPGFLRETYNKLGYVFDHNFDSTGLDFDLLIYALANRCLRDARSIKFHHSIGPIYSEDSKLMCGCYENKKSHSVRTISQIRMDSQKPSEIENLLENKWHKSYIFMGYLACINRLSNNFMNSMKSNKKNYPANLIIKSLVKYILNKFLRPSFWR